MLNDFAHCSDLYHLENEFWNKTRVNPCNPPTKVTDMSENKSLLWSYL